MLEDALQQLIQNEIEKGIEEFKDDLYDTKLQLDEYKEKYCHVISELDSLVNLQDKLDNLKVLIDSVTIDNIEFLVSNVGLKSRKISFSGMDSESIPTWFKLLCTYYDDKERLFSLFDIFNIEYPNWSKAFKMPYDYNEEELDLIFDGLGKMYVCNGQIFDGNMGFFWTYQRKFKGDLLKLFRNESYVEIPWNLFLQNPLLTTDKYFDKIITAIEKGRNNSYYFYMIQKYQDINYEQSYKLASLLPERLNDYHKFFVDNNKELLKQRLDLADKFKNNINDNQYSTFYYLKYPVSMQKEFIKNYTGYDSKYKMVEKMDIHKDEKIKLLMEIAEIELK